MIAAISLPAVSAQNMMRWMLFGVLAMGMLSLQTGSGTLAYFTTQVQSNNNTFTAGNLRFNIQDSITTTGQYPAVGSSLSLANIKPGQTVYAPIKLTNVGNLAATFGIKYSTTTAYATNGTGGAVSGSTTTLIDTGHNAVANTAFPASLIGDYVVLTAGTGANTYGLISASAASQITFAAIAAGPAADTVYSVAKWASKSAAGGTTTSLIDTGGAPAWGNLDGYSVTVLTGAQAGQTSKVTAHTVNTLTLGTALPGALAANDVYYVSPTNLAPVLNLGILGRGAGTGTPTVGGGANDCNAATYTTPAGIWSETAPGAGSPAKALGLMLAGGATLSAVATGTPMIATTGSDVLCMQVNWPDGGLPPTLTTGDNAYNGATAGAYATNLNFVFDGQ